MGRKPFRSPDEKLQVVLSVLKGEVTQVEIARRLQMSQTTIAKWQKQFLEGASRWRAARTREVPPAAASRTSRPRSRI